MQPQWTKYYPECFLAQPEGSYVVFGSVFVETWGGSGLEKRSTK